MSTIKKACIVAILAWIAGCGPLAVDGYRVHSASGVPSDRKSYPHIEFEDQEAYLVGSDWLIFDSTYGWVVFDDEPPALRAFRERTYAVETHGAR